MPSETGITSILGIEQQSNKNISGGYAGLDANGYNNPSFPTATQDTVITNDAVVNITGSLTELKRTNFSTVFTGTLNISFMQYNSAAGSNSTCQIYKNGAPIGVSHNIVGVNAILWQEAFTGTFMPTDYFSVYGSCNLVGTEYIANFDISRTVQYILFGTKKVAYI